MILQKADVQYAGYPWIEMIKLEPFVRIPKKNYNFTFLIELLKHEIYCFFLFGLPDVYCM